MFYSSRHVVVFLGFLLAPVCLNFKKVKLYTKKPSVVYISVMAKAKNNQQETAGPGQHVGQDQNNNSLTQKGSN